ncbi:MAG: helix-turn-helix domain-containing protein [Myxococcota bacterium]
MRAARLLQMLLLLQNRGRLTSAELAEELEVARRTILRDVDAMTEAGLPIVVTRGNRGGIELGFNYRTRLTGLAADEAEALAVLLNTPTPAIDALGMRRAAGRARAKLIESLPDGVRERIYVAQDRFRFADVDLEPADPRLPALAEAVRGQRIVHVRAHTSETRRVHPVALVRDAADWSLLDANAAGSTVPRSEWGDINISAKTFDA